MKPSACTPLLKEKKKSSCRFLILCLFVSAWQQNGPFTLHTGLLCTLERTITGSIWPTNQHSGCNVVTGSSSPLKFSHVHLWLRVSVTLAAVSAV